MSDVPNIPFGQQLPSLFAVKVNSASVAVSDNLYAVTRMLAEMDELIAEHANEDVAPMMRDLIAAAQNGLADAEIANRQKWVWYTAVLKKR